MNRVTPVIDGYPSTPQPRLTFDDVAYACSDRRECFKGRVENWSLLEWAGSLVGEQGEFIEALVHQDTELLLKKWTAAGGKLANFAKKAKRKDGGFTGEMGKELADVLIYSFLMAEELGLDLAECVIHKFNEVSLRVDKINMDDPDIPKAPRLSAGYAEQAK